MPSTVTTTTNTAVRRSASPPSPVTKLARKFSRPVNSHALPSVADVTALTLIRTSCTSG
jgi:hypothetical protein